MLTEKRLSNTKLGTQNPNTFDFIESQSSCCAQISPPTPRKYAIALPQSGLSTVIAIAGLFLTLLILAGFIKTRMSRRASGLTGTNLKLQDEIAERNRTEALLKGQNQVLQMIANKAPLTQSLTLLIQTIEAQSPDMLGSILLLDDDGIHVRNGAAPSLPAAFVAAVEGQPIGPKAGSCGTSAWRKEAVYVEDIATDPLWEQYKAIALPHGLRSCWSTPIFDEHHKVLGTFAMYHRTTGLPTPVHQQLIDISIDLAAIAIKQKQTLTSLTAKDEELELYFTTSLDLLLIANFEGQFLRLNPEWEDTLGYALDELHGELFIDFVHPDDAEATLNALTDLAVERRVLNFVNRYRHKDGSYRWFEWRAFARENGLFYAVARDITEQRLAEEALRASEARLRLILDGLGEHIFVGLMDPDGTVLLVNSAALESSGLALEDVVGESFPTTIWWSHSDATQQRISEALKRAAKGETVRYDEQISTASGQLVWVDCTIHPLRDESGNISFIVPSGIVIEERKHAEAKLLQLNRFYKTLSGANDAIARAYDEDSLFQQVCEIIAQSAEFELIWIGNSANESVEIIAAAGPALGYLDARKASTNTENPDGQNAFSFIYRSGEYYICNDFTSDQETILEGDNTSNFNIRSYSAFPLKKAGKISAILNVYSTVPDIFQRAEIKLLEELAQNISFSLDYLEQQSYLRQTMSSLQLSKQKLEESNSKLLISETKYRSIFESLQDVYVDTTLDGRILDISSQISELSNGQYNREELIGENIKAVYHDIDQWEELLTTLHNDGRVTDFEVDIRNKKGELIACSVSASLIPDEGGKPHRIASMFRDITERNANLAKLSYLAQYDSLTDLPNRLLFKDRLDQAILEADRHERQVVVLLLDIDRFKNINDTLGHEAGDYTLIEVGNRLTQAFGSGDTVSRLSGDEFAVLFPDLGDANDATLLLSKVTDLFKRPIRFDNRELLLTSSIGITVYPLDNGNSETLLRNADIALNRAKEVGHNNYQFYDSEMTVKAQYKLSLEESLQYAVARDELVLHYQPQVDIKSGMICGMEALLRWNHPELGLVSPAVFIPLAEETGLILPIGEWVLRTATAQMKLWQSYGYTSLRIAVNLSSMQFQESNILDVVRSALEESSLEACFLELELTESMLLKNINQTIETLISLRQLGVQLSIDDFGTGYSSLSYLRKFPISVLKIDQSFVRDINDGHGAASIVKTIIQMAHSLDMNVVAEGVETIEQLHFLSENHCDSIQGYYFSKPVPADEFTKLLETNKTLSLNA